MHNYTMKALHATVKMKDR